MCIHDFQSSDSFYNYLQMLYEKLGIFFTKNNLVFKTFLKFRLKF